MLLSIKSVNKIVIPLAIFFVSVVFISFINNGASVNAQVCDPEEAIFGSGKVNFTLDIRRTVDNMVTSVPISVFSKTTGGSPARTLGCLDRANNSTTNQGAKAVFAKAQGGCAPDATATEDFCQGLTNTYEDAEVITMLLRNPDSHIHHSGGSLLGLVSSADRASYEPIPVNLAYYWNKQTEKIPFMGHALAQANPGDAYSGPYMGVIYSIWAMFRNAAYGLMAVIMVVIGILIMTRKKISPQASVTVQYALPRIIVALVLITFSYPIGATIASFAWALRYSVGSIIETLAVGGPAVLADIQSANALLATGVVTMLLVTLAIAIQTGGTSLFVFLFLLILLIIVAFMYLVVIIKIFLTYLRILVSIVGAPIIFMIGAIPGKEETTINWFKKAGVYLLSIFAMSGVLTLTHMVNGLILINMTRSGVAGAVGGTIVAAFVAFFILIYGYNLARTIPEKIDLAIMGKQR